MKKSILFSLALFLIFEIPVNAQGRLLNKAKNSIANEILWNPDGSPQKTKQQPEPACACDQPVLVMDMGEKLKLDYQELTISILDDSRILAKTRGTE